MNVKYALNHINNSGSNSSLKNILINWNLVEKISLLLNGTTISFSSTVIETHC